MSKTRYSVVAKREPSAKEAIVKLLDTETRITEAVELLVRFGEDLDGLEGADAMLCDTVRRLTEARAMLHELRRAKLGQPTIASVG